MIPLYRLEHVLCNPLFGKLQRGNHLAQFLTRRDMAHADRFKMIDIEQGQPTRKIANQPYQIDDDTDWFIPTHAEPRGVRHALVEIRNDQLRNAAGVEVWADLLSNAISALLETAP